MSWSRFWPASSVPARARVATMRVLTRMGPPSRGAVSGGPPLLLQPAGPDAGLPVPAGVRLDIEDGRPVDEVEAGDPEDAAVAAQEPQDAEAERVRAVRRPRGEDAPGLRLARRDDFELHAPGLVEMEEDDDVGEPFQPVEPGREGRLDLDLARRALEEPRRGEGGRRQVGRVLVRRADKADGPETESRPYLPTVVSHFS